jgi:ATP-dependent RNA helicase DDX56/DBP9
MAAASASAGLDSRLVRACGKVKWLQPTTVQAEAIPLALQGRDLLLRAQTGSGKTGAYVLAGLQRLLERGRGGEKAAGGDGPEMLVLVPTRELVGQTVRVVEELSSYCRESVGGVAGLDGQRGLAAEAAQLGLKPRVVVSTPGRLVSHLRSEHQRGRKPLSYDAATKLDAWARAEPSDSSSASSGQYEAPRLLRSVQFLVIDEADAMSGFGHEEDMRRIAGSMPPTQAVLASATLPSAVDDLRRLLLRRPAVLRVEDSATDGELQQFTLDCGSEERWVLLVALLKLGLLRGRTALFCNQVDEAYRLRLVLSAFGVGSAVHNPQLPASTRTMTVARFHRGDFDILICASDPGTAGPGADGPSAKRRRKRAAVAAAAEAAEAAEGGGPEERVDEAVRGLDLRNVATVVNWDTPATLEAYKHRVGRAARGGRSGVALTILATPDARAFARDVLGPALGEQLSALPFDAREVEGFRYRVRDALQQATSSKVRSARLEEVQAALAASEKLKAHFEDNPRDLQALLDGSAQSAAARLRHDPGNLVVPDYLLAAGPQQTMRAVDLGALAAAGAATGAAGAAAGAAGAATGAGSKRARDDDGQEEEGDDGREPDPEHALKPSALETAVAAASLLNPEAPMPIRRLRKDGTLDEPVAGRNKWALRHKVGKYRPGYKSRVHVDKRRLPPSKRPLGLHALGSGGNKGQRDRGNRPF